MPASPCSVTPRKRCGWAAARRASIAICTPPSVPFLNPTGIEHAEASSRWVWLSVVRAPIAPHETRSEMNCGVIGSRNSQPAGSPISARSSSRRRPRRSPSLIDERSVEVGVVDQALPADRGPRLLEVDAHDDAEIGGQLVGELPQPAGVVQSGCRDRGSSTGRRSRPAGRPVPSRISTISSRPRATVSAAVSVTGSSSSRIAGGRSGRMLSTRRSRVRIGMSGRHPLEFRVPHSNSGG